MLRPIAVQTFGVENASKAEIYMKLLMSFALSFVAGYADILCYVRYHSFATMMTGNLLLAANSFVADGCKMNQNEEMPECVFALLVVAFRMAGYTAHFLAEWWHPRGEAILAPLMVLAVAGVEFANYFTKDDLYPSRWDVLMMAPIFGVQSAVSTKGLIGAPTCVATGHMQNLTNAIDNMVFNSGRLSLEDNGVQMAVPAGILAGALLGALAEKRFGGSSGEELLLTPAVVVLAICVGIDDYFTTPTPEDIREFEVQELDHAGSERQARAAAVPASYAPLHPSEADLKIS